MRQHITFISSSLNPIESQNAQAVINIINKVESLYDITVICPGKNKLITKSYTIMNYYNVYNVVLNFQKRCLKSNIYIIKFVGTFIKMVLKIYRFIMANLSIYSYSFFDYISVRKKLKVLHRKKPIHTIISISFPFVNFQAGYFFKKKYPAIQFITYSLDIYSERIRGYIFNRHLFTRIVSKENKIYELANMNLVKEDFQNSRENKWNNKKKQKVVGVPFLTDRTKKDTSIGNLLIKLVYAGTFQKGVRVPGPLIKLIKELNNTNILFEIAYRGKFDKQFNQLDNTNNNQNIVIHKELNREAVDDLYYSANVFINISNLDIKQTPSKIFEYMSFGKPILNIVYHESQIINEKTYQLIYNVFHDKICEERDEILTFITNSANKRMNFDKINEMNNKNTAEYLSEIINGIIQGILK